jgi:hypothetical protein
MNSMMRFTTRNFCLSIAAAMMAMATGARAADAAPVVQPAAEQLDELGEIWVRGKSLARTISDAEDDFYKLYNALNRNDNYDVTCGLVSLSPGSMIMRRSCMADFLIEAITVQTASSCSTQNNRYDPQGYTGVAQYYSATCTSTSPGVYEGPPAEAVLLERGRSWAVHMMMVINSDPRLKEKAGHLDDLYREMRLVQGRYVKVKSALEDAKPVRVHAGPRAL